ncbi:hypothetical protein N8691_03770 [Candidatus Pelagibacter sp.]|nr:hypothetical protein [Candidatus Pelagibacter sp.]
MIFLSIHCGHNATVALSIKGEIVCVLSEERVTRVKNFIGFPLEAIKSVVKKFLDNDISRIDKFVFIDGTGLALRYIKNQGYKPKEFSSYAWDGKKNFLRRNKLYGILGNKNVNFIAKIYRNFNRKNLRINKNKILNKILELNPEIKFDLKKVVFFDHHEMHALSHRYFKNTDKNNYIIFTMDGEGDNLSSTVNIFQKGEIENISKNSNDHSIGYFFAETTKLLGLKAFEHEFKVMGMAPYSRTKDVNRILKNLDNLIFLKNDGSFNSKVVSSLFKYEIDKIFKYEKFENVCGAAQVFTEKLILNWIKYWVKKTSINNVVLSGGVFMNIKACKEVSKLDVVNEMLVVPSCSDESLPFGALYKINKLNNQNISIVKNLYLGMSYSENIDDFIDKLDKKKFTVKKYKDFQDLNIDAAKLIAENNIIARCAGREEWGARALGNRSILCNPSQLENIKIINEAIKQRDYWMPFSPSILKDDANKYFLNPKNVDARFMTCLFESTDLAKNHLKAAIHPIDHSMRPQLIDEEINREYHDLILKFKKISGIGGLLNTSFNLHGEPNVGDYDSAIHTVINSKLNYLIVENYLIEKNLKT